MTKYILLFVLIISNFLTGCVSPVSQPSATENILIVTSSSGMTKPLISGWDLGETSEITQGDISIAILGVQLSDARTDIFTHCSVVIPGSL